LRRVGGGRKGWWGEVECEFGWGWWWWWKRRGWELEGKRFDEGDRLEEG